MSFILEQSPTFSWPIVIREVQDGGRHRTHQFEAIFRRLPQSRMEEVQLQYQQMKAAVARDQVVDGIPTRDIAAEILVGWNGITEADGSTPIEFSETAKRQLLEVAMVADVLVTTYFEAHEKARTKN
jgi:hypothetical protein